MTKVILPGSGNTVCILGAGQLGKMTQAAAHQFGFDTIVWAPEGDIPAMKAATHRLVAPFNDRHSLEEVCRVASVVTTEWENVPISLLQALEKRGVLVRPSSFVLGIAQSRNAEKTFARSVDVEPTPWVFLEQGKPIPSAEVLAGYFPGILKHDRLGYDGKGQWPVANYDELVWRIATVEYDCILERRIDLNYELSILVARSPTGLVSVSPAVANKHRDGILVETTWRPGLFQKYIELDAQDAAMKIAEKLQLEGILVLEFFVDFGGHLYFNEMAPRPHNSFHGSIEAARTSQFEQQVRAVCGLPLGQVWFHTAFVMKNLLGDAGWDLAELFQQPAIHIHLYGKTESRPGRKMGHVTRMSRHIKM